MADDRMRNDDRDRNMGGGAGQGNKDDFGQQTPGRKQQDDLSTGHRGSGQDKGQQKEPQHIEDDFGTRDKSGQRDQNR